MFYRMRDVVKGVDLVWGRRVFGVISIKLYVEVG